MRRATAALVAALALAGPACSAWNPFKVDAADVYRANFEWPPLTLVNELRGGGALWGHDVWIRFAAPAPIRLRAHAMFADTDPRSCAGPFLKLLPEERAILEDRAHLTCLTLSARARARAGGKVLLVHQERGIYYFRTFAGS